MHTVLAVFCAIALLKTVQCTLGEAALLTSLNAYTSVAKGILLYTYLIQPSKPIKDDVTFYCYNR